MEGSNKKLSDRCHSDPKYAKEFEHSFYRWSVKKAYLVLFRKDHSKGMEARAMGTRLHMGMNKITYGDEQVDR